MLGYFKKRKVEKGFNADIKTLEDIHKNKLALKAKYSEIYDSDLTQVEKDGLFSIINSQMKTVDQDVLIYGATMQPYFPENQDRISRVVPRGVDLNYFDFYRVDANEKLSTYFMTVNSHNLTGPSNITERITNRMTERDAADEITDEKLKNIKRLPLKAKIKENLTAMHKAKLAERKTKLVKYVNGVKPPLAPLQREIASIKSAVMATIDMRNQSEMINDLSTLISAMERSIVYDRECYKRFLNVTPIMTMSMPPQLAEDTRTDIKNTWIQSLRETGDFVITKGL